MHYQYYYDHVMYSMGHKHSTHLPSSLTRCSRRKGSDLPKKSFLSSLVARKCNVTSSFVPLTSSHRTERHVRHRLKGQYIHTQNKLQHIHHYKYSCLNQFPFSTKENSTIGTISYNSLKQSIIIITPLAQNGSKPCIPTLLLHTIFSLLWNQDTLVSLISLRSHSPVHTMPQLLPIYLPIATNPVIPERCIYIYAHLRLRDMLISPQKDDQQDRTSPQN